MKTMPEIESNSTSEDSLLLWEMGVWFTRNICSLEAYIAEGVYAFWRAERIRALSTRAHVQYLQWKKNRRYTFQTNGTSLVVFWYHTSLWNTNTNSRALNVEIQSQWLEKLILHKDNKDPIFYSRRNYYICSELRSHIFRLVRHTKVRSRHNKFNKKGFFWNFYYSKQSSFTL